jgi:AraC-like DNA-binding protein/quercetin dioxygenase-like cupin family protein
MTFKPTALNIDIKISKVVTIHYFEHAKDYVFRGESHDFWEFVYVDKGKVEVMADTQGYELKQGEMIFHKPKEYHNLWANGKIAPNLVIVTFICGSPSMDFFKNKILTIGSAEKDLLAGIISEAEKAFSSDFGDPDMKGLERADKKSFGSEQLIKIYLEQLLIHMIRSNTSIKSKSRLSSVAKERSDSNTVEKIADFLRGHVRSSITFGDVLRYSNMSATSLKTMFKEKTGLSVMEYYRNLKIEKAKELIREKDFNITQVANKLGYKTIHHFSKQFKDITGMSPSEYARSVKAVI